MDVEENKKLLLEQVVFTTEKPIYSGGQNCGIKNNSIIGKSEDLGIEIKCNYHRSDIKNKEFILNSFKLIINDLIK